ncbi:hypothetical protein EDF56_101132 [Novosphingobium sp. PhB165]|uniref:hypothetical protein n=1 Tax=Novosphingobium sp. PhB165 TaxID=2485105 RepID=UPI00104E3723|nr:hypothetical protein [Novosphingobium sp. PhB165]TCM21468.1 hypothetical protein EDF56_101132 [Novosphingobium sp. PhB165]
MSETDNSMALMLGEIRGEVRQVVDHVAVLASKIDALTTAVNQAAHLPEELQALKVRVTALEASEQQRRGAMSLGAAIMKALPWLLPAIAAGGAAAVVTKGVGL